MTTRFTLESLGLAYRKAKVDLYYSTHPSLFAIADYEAKLTENLSRLLSLINGKDESWVEQAAFLGNWTLAPKSIECGGPEQDAAHQHADPIFASPDDEWAAMVQSGHGLTAQFRLMARCSLDFHVLSALWMLKVGDVYDKALGENVYGSRLRRSRLRRNRHDHVNELALGSFKPYLRPFREWRDTGIKAMRSALADKKKIVALTADVASFYHELNPGFMLDQNFLGLAGIGLDESQAKLNRLFDRALRAWAQQTPLKRGLPVGLPASAVVANMALFELDRFIEQQVVPLYYGRYVDDILLVMENTSDIANTDRFWQWVFSRDGGKGLFEWERPEDPKKRCVRFKPGYLKDSRIAFENSKNKLFILAGETGSALVNAISEQINQRASEWRALPHLPESPGTVATDLLKATNHAGEQADNLRKTDALTLHRAGFALNLRDYEAFERDLPPAAWREHRHAFFRAVIDHLLTPVKFFELAQYLPRIIRMATACEDFEHLGKIIEALNELVEKVRESSTPAIKSLAPEKAPGDSIDRWQRALFQSVAESVVAAFPPTLSRVGTAAWAAHLAVRWQDLADIVWPPGSANDGPIVTHRELQKHQARLFSLDLAHIPLRFAGLPKETVSRRGIPARRLLTVGATAGLLPGKILEGVSALARWLKFKPGIPGGLTFATRPFSLTELYLVAPAPFASESFPDLNKVIMALRGFELAEHKMPLWEKRQLLRIPEETSDAKQTIAVASWKTEYDSFVAAVVRRPDPDARRRYQRINRLISALISWPAGSKYLVLPELSMPPHWFMRVADKLKGRGISLLTGVEYLHAPKRGVRNQIWASLTHDGLGFPSVLIYRQDKQRPALHEEQEIHRLGGLKLRPDKAWTTPPIVQHGDFRFSLLVCSELTNIAYRSALRGKVDALFVPEWNQDTETFNALVESAALDVHAFIIQCNDRQYGDSRIRAPYKDSWKRDVLRVKGGVTDYCVIGEIDTRALRRFQSSYRSPSGPFKPAPDGFEICDDRKVLPAGESE